MKFETLGDWCKWLEKNFTPEIMIPTLPTIIRIDGNNFSKWTKGLNKPFEPELTDLMIDLTKYLVETTNAVIGYTQSDEITLILYNDDREKSIYNDGKKQKILSKLTGSCVSYFNEQRLKYLPNHNKIANFDCRIYQTPTLIDACAQLLWRENDAIRNSISMLAQSHFSYNQLQNLNTKQMKNKLIEIGVYWHELPDKFKKGTYIKRIRKEIPFSKEELDKLPEKHQAKQDPNLLIERNIYIKPKYPNLNDIENKVDVIFNDKEPIIKPYVYEN